MGSNYHVDHTIDKRNRTVTGIELDFIINYLPVREQALQNRKI